MLNKLILKNFQSHINTEIEFSPGLNILTGATHSGKTSIIRALKMALRNKPKNLSPETYIRHGEDAYTIVLDIDGHIIERERGGRINSYKMDGNDFDTVGTQVPEVIQDFFGSSEINVGKEDFDLSFFEQWDGPFLVRDNGGVQARAIGKLSGVDMLDEGVRIANDEGSKASKITEETKREIKELEFNIENLKDIDYARIIYDNIEGNTNKLEEKNKVFPELKNLLKEYKKVNLILSKNYKKIEESLNLINVEKLEEKRKLVTEYINILNKKKKYKKVNKESIENFNIAYDNCVNFIQGIEKRQKFEEEFKPKLDFINKWNNFKSNLISYGSKLKNIKTTADKIIEVEGNLITYGEYKRVWYQSNQVNETIKDSKKQLKIVEKELENVINEAEKELGKIKTCEKCDQPEIGLKIENIF